MIDEWMNEVPDSAQGKFDSRLAFMKDRLHWQHHIAHQMKDCDGIWEVKFDAGNIAYRPLFFMGPGKGELTFVFFAIEHNDRLRPSGALGTAITRMNDVIALPVKAIRYDG